LYSSFFFVSASVSVRIDRVPQAGLLAEALDRDHRVRHGFVSIALFFADHQQAFAWRLVLNDALRAGPCTGHQAHGQAHGGDDSQECSMSRHLVCGESYSHLISPN
jgi:hypothetical protein